LLLFETQTLKRREKGKEEKAKKNIWFGIKTKSPTPGRELEGQEIVEFFN